MNKKLEEMTLRAATEDNTVHFWSPEFAERLIDIFVSDIIKEIDTSAEKIRLQPYTYSSDRAAGMRMAADILTQWRTY